MRHMVFASRMTWALNKIGLDILTWLYVSMRSNCDTEEHFTNVPQIWANSLTLCFRLAHTKGVHDAVVHWKGQQVEKWNGPVADAVDSQQLEEVLGFRGKFSRRRPKHQEKNDKKDLQNHRPTTQMAVRGSTWTQGTMAWIDILLFYRNHYSVIQSPSTKHRVHLGLNWSDPTRAAIVAELTATQDVLVCGGEAA